MNLEDKSLNEISSKNGKTNDIDSHYELDDKKRNSGLNKKWWKFVIIAVCLFCFFLFLIGILGNILDLNKNGDKSSYINLKYLFYDGWIKCMTIKESHGPESAYFGWSLFFMIVLFLTFIFALSTVLFYSSKTIVDSIQFFQDDTLQFTIKNRIIRCLFSIALYLFVVLFLRYESSVKTIESVSIFSKTVFGWGAILLFIAFFLSITCLLLIDLIDLGSDINVSTISRIVFRYLSFFLIIALGFVLTTGVCEVKYSLDSISYTNKFNVNKVIIKYLEDKESSGIIFPLALLGTLNFIGLMIIGFVTSYYIIILRNNRKYYKFGSSFLFFSIVSFLFFYLATYEYSKSYVKGSQVFNANCAITICLILLLTYIWILEFAFYNHKKFNKVEIK